MTLTFRLRQERFLMLPVAFLRRLTNTRPKACKCKSGCDEFWLFFHDFSNVKSVDKLTAKITALIQSIWVASYTQELKPCVLSTVRECIQACKRAEFPLILLSQFYEYQVEGQSILASIILHSLSDSLSRSKTRHHLLQIILDELPLTAAARDELFLACARTEFHEYFKCIRTKSSKWLQTLPVDQVPLLSQTRLASLKLQTGIVKIVTETPHWMGFTSTWFVSDILQRLLSGFHIGTEFVAKGRIWGLYISTHHGRRPEVTLCVLKPSQIPKGKNIDVSIKLTVSPSDKHEFNKSEITFTFETSSLSSTAEFPVEGSIPSTDTSWIFSEEEANLLYKHINENGSCYLTFYVDLPRDREATRVKCYKSKD